MDDQTYEDKHGNICRDLLDGRTLMAYPITFGRARLSIGPTGGFAYDDTW